MNKYLQICVFYTIFLKRYTPFFNLLYNNIKNIKETGDTMDGYKLDSCIYTNASYYIDEFTSYMQQFEDFLPYDKKCLLSQEHYVLTFNYWINLIDSPYIHIVKSDRFIFHSLSYTLHNIIKHHPLTISLKEHYPNNNLCIFFYSYAISHEIRRSILKYLPKPFVENYYLSLNKSSFFDQTDEDSNKEYNREIVMIKKLAFYQLHTDIEIHQIFSAMLNNCTLLAEEYIQKHPEYHFNNYPS